MRVNNRKWKANLLDYEWIAQQEGAKCYCLSDKTAQMLLTISQTLAWPTRWTGNELFTDEQRENIFQWANKAEAELLNGCCGDSGQTIRIRVNAEGRVEVSIDGGETWTPDDNYDPRSTGTIYPPNNTGAAEDNACQAATNVVANMTELINEDFVGVLASLTGLAAISAALAPFVAGWMGVPVAGQGVAVAAFIAGLVGAGAAEGAAALTDAFDAEFYDWLKCEYLCRVGNREATWGDIDGIINALNIQYPGGGDDFTLRVVGFWVFKALGPVGITNMARLGAGAADCTTCECAPWCWFADFTGSQAQGFAIGEPPYDQGELSSAGWTATIDTPNNIKQVDFTRNWELTTITKITVTYSIVVDPEGNNRLRWYPMLDGVILTEVQFDITADATDAEWVIDYTLSSPITINGGMFELKCGSFEPYGSGSIHSIKFEGVGVPIEEPNCEP